MRGRYFTLDQAAKAYPVFTRRLLRRLVEQRRIAFSRAGRLIVLAESDIEQYLETNRTEIPRRGPYAALSSLHRDARDIDRKILPASEERPDGVDSPVTPKSGTVGGPLPRSTRSSANPDLRQAR
jgi:excisionase family DNA binding protein